MSGQRIRHLLPGAVLHFDTPIGAVVRVAYKDNGKMRGRAPGLGFYLGTSSDRGEWWVKASKLCQKWTTWFDKRTRCFGVKKKGLRIYWAEENGKSGVARIASRRPEFRKTKRALQKTATVNLIKPPKLVTNSAKNLTVSPMDRSSPYKKAHVVKPAIKVMPLPHRKPSDALELTKKRQHLGREYKLAVSVQTVQVKPENTLYSLAKAHKSTVIDIMRFNNMKTTLLLAGQSIRIPQARSHMNNHSAHPKTFKQPQNNEAVFSAQCGKSSSCRNETWLQKANRKAEEIWSKIRKNQR